jgi:hypothetical protein
MPVLPSPPQPGLLVPAFLPQPNLLPCQTYRFESRARTAGGQLSCSWWSASSVKQGDVMEKVVVVSGVDGGWWSRNNHQKKAVSIESTTADCI